MKDVGWNMFALLIWGGMLFLCFKGCTEGISGKNKYDTEYYEDRDQGRGVDAPRRSRSRGRGRR